jgi:D-glycero-D-manno-heptose 1,7-bisphosphate phosphatase
MEKRRAVFLDRDGVINPLIYHQDHGIVDSPFTLRQFSVLPRVPQAIRLLNDLGFAVVVASNQPGIAKRHFDLDLLGQFENKLRKALTPSGAHIDAAYYCLHHPDASVRKYRLHCDCRKPAAGMLRQATDELGLSLEDSYMIGDGLTDIEAGHTAGCQTIFIGRWKCEYEQFIHPPDLRPSFVAKDLWEAAKLIQSQLAESLAVSASTARPTYTEPISPEL